MRAEVKAFFDNTIILTALEEPDVKVGDKVEISKPKEKRTLDANAYLWVCIGEIAKHIKLSPWETYLHVLRRYGQYSTIEIKAEAYDRFKTAWRECQIVAEDYRDGIKFYRVLCFFGSSKYTKEEFAQLLDGVISEIEEMGIPVPPTRQDIEDFRKYIDTRIRI